MIEKTEQNPALHPGSYVDPAGQLYEFDDYMLRGMHAEFAEFYRTLISRPPVSTMLGRQIIETTIAAEGLANYPLTLRHPKVSPVSFCYEWPAPMLRAAALLTLDICSELSSSALTLKDASPWNVLFIGTQPVFVDFTSLADADRNLFWVAYEQFCRLFLYPLALYRYFPGKSVRPWLYDSINGISPDELVRLLPCGAVLSQPWLLGRVYFPRWLLGLVRRLGADQKLMQTSAQLQPQPEARRAFFASLAKDIRATPLHGSTGRWVHYYEDIETFMQPAQFQLKQATVARLLDECKPKNVVDIGCNQGGYAILAARAGAQVTAFDADEDCVNLLYKFAAAKQLPILPLVMDFLNPSPACGWRTRQFPSAPQRFHAEMAMALALVHHLAITQRQTFDRIASALADYADRWLLTEFVPITDPRVQELMISNRRDLSWYSLEGFIAALRCEFGRVETFPSHPEGRVLILCSR